MSVVIIIAWQTYVDPIIFHAAKINVSHFEIMPSRTGIMSSN